NGLYPFSGGIDEVAIYPTALSAAQVANHYALRTAVNSITLPLVATDADGDALTYSATGLPPGLILNPGTGVITGDPLVPGPYAVTVTAMDPAELTDTKSFTWTITSTPLANPHVPVLTNPGDHTNAVTDYGYAG